MASVWLGDRSGWGYVLNPHQIHFCRHDFTAGDNEGIRLEPIVGSLEGLLRTKLLFLVG
jgi:hypothetical protein